MITLSIRGIRAISLSETLINRDTQEASRQLFIRTDREDIVISLVTNANYSGNLVLETELKKII